MSERETPWTKGPWHDAKDFGLTPETTRCVVLSTVWGRVATMSYPDSGSDEANARLIAAAPEMAELCAEKAAVFRHYEQLHREKGTPEGNAKADDNAKHAADLEALLSRIHGESA